MLRVRDIMTKKVYTVDFDASAEEAAWGMTRREVGSAPVRNRDGALVGMLTKADLADPAPRDWVKKDPTVGDLMNPEVQAVYEDDAALVAAHEMVTRNIHGLVVLNAVNQLVGIVSTMDIVRAVDAGLTFAVGDLSGSPQVGVL